MKAKIVLSVLFGFMWVQILFSQVPYVSQLYCPLRNVKDIISNGKVLFAIASASDTTNIDSLNSRFLFKSEDCGVTWERINFGSLIRGSNKYATQVSAIDFDHDTLYVSHGYQAYNSDGLLVSRDLKTFEWVLKWSWDPIFCIDFENGFGWIAIGNYGSLSGISKRDQSGTWSYRLGNSSGTGVIITHPVAPDRVVFAVGRFAGLTSSFARTLDGGITWHDSKFRIMFSSIINGKPYIFSYTTFSTDFGDSWHDLNIPNSSIESFAQGENNTIYMSRYSWAPYRTEIYLWTPTAAFQSTGIRFENKLISKLVNMNGYLFALDRYSGYLIRTVIPNSAFTSKVNDNLPSDFSLKQNFPNPFNPETVISYQLAVTCFVSLKVYDVLGKEIITLVSTEKLQGKHEVKLDASKLSSGVYYYKLTAGNFTQIKKMILMK